MRFIFRLGGALLGILAIDLLFNPAEGPIARGIYILAVLLAAFLTAYIVSGLLEDLDNE